jgi:hypothetical protein
MTPRAGGLVLCGAIAAAAPFAQGQTPAQQRPQPVFRSTTDVVTVPVFVTGDRDAVAGLSAADFVLTDNGVRQAVEMIDSRAVPVDVTVLVETSAALADYADDLNKQVRRIAGMVRPADRLEVIGVGDYVTVLVPFGPPGDVEGIEVMAEGLTSINDALVAALVRDPDPDRRHLVVALTDSVDTMSTVDLRTVRDVARQSNATLVVSWITLSIDAQWSPPGRPRWSTSHERVSSYVRGQRSVPRRQRWTPHIDPPPGRTIDAFELLKEATELTGGGLHPPGVFVNRSASAVFDKVYAEFRQSILLRYRPEGVAREGWHDLTVTIPRFANLDVRARRGYLVEPPLAAQPASSVTSSVAASGPLEALVAAAGADNVDEVRARIAAAAGAGRLAELIGAFRERGHLWPREPRREFALALELAAAAVPSRSPEAAAAGLELLETYERLVRPPLGPDDFERDWLLAEAAILTGAMRPADTRPRIRTTLARLPQQPRLRLARAVIADQVTLSPEGARALKSVDLDQILAAYDSVQDDLGAVTEARIRKAWLLRRIGRDADAAAALAVVDPGNTTVMEWRDLVAKAEANTPMRGAVWETYWRADARSLRRFLTRLWEQ